MGKVILFGQIRVNTMVNLEIIIFKEEDSTSGIMEGPTKDHG